MAVIKDVDAMFDSAANLQHAELGLHVTKGCLLQYE